MTFGAMSWLTGMLTFCVGCQALAGIEERKLSDDSATSGKGAARADGGAQDASAPPALCEKYCKEVASKCQDEYAVYSNMTSCVAICGELELGTIEDKGGNNTVGCRYNQALGISAEPTDCDAAGPGGGGVCGDNCDSYCRLMSRACKEDEYRQYWLGDVDKCVARCRGLRDRALDADRGPNDSKYSALDNNSRDHNGDTVQCRLFHASVASSSPAGPIGHCWHAALSPRSDENGSPNPCMGEIGQVAPRCQDYCRLIETACPSDLQVYENTQQCQKTCAAFAPGTLMDGNANTLGCRYAHTYNALDSSEALTPKHCGHAGPGGSGVCGNDCESYCSLLSQACGDEFKAMGEMTGCLAACRSIAPGTDGLMYSVSAAKSGGSELACRLLGVVRALEDPKVEATACALAAGKASCM